MARSLPCRGLDVAVGDTKERGQPLEKDSTGRRRMNLIRTTRPPSLEPKLVFQRKAL